MDQQPVQRDPTSTLLRLLRGLCAAAPGGDEFLALLRCIWRWLRARRQGAALATVGVTLPLDGCSRAALGVDDDDAGSSIKNLAKNKNTDLAKNKNIDLTDPAALVIDSKGENAGLAGLPAHGVDPKGKNIDLTDPAALVIDSKGENAGLAGLPALGVDPKGKNTDLAGSAALGVDTEGKNIDLTDPAALGVDPKGKNADLAGPAALGVDPEGKNTHLAGPAALGVDPEGKNSDLTDPAALGVDPEGKNADLAGSAALGVDPKGKNADLAGSAALGVDPKGKNEDDVDPFTPAAGPAAAGKNEPAPPARSVRRPGRARRRPAQAVPRASATPVLDDLQDDESFFDREVDECKAMHLRYRAACSSLKKKRTLCLECFLCHERNSAKERPPVPMNNGEQEVQHHMGLRHKKSGSDWSRCKKHGCFAMTVTPQDMGHHQLHAHRM